jgi:hypothetical protein
VLVVISVNVSPTDKTQDILLKDAQDVERTLQRKYTIEGEGVL